MKCPFCGKLDDKVIDSREGKDGDVVRRRRECLSCHRRFTTYEKVEQGTILVVKKDGRREPFDRGKIVAGFQKACEKRPVSINTIEAIVGKMEQEFQESGEKEISTTAIGEKVMRALHELDQVAYVRFASVYRQFKDINEFMAELKDLLNQQKSKDKTDSEQEAKA